MTYFNESRFCPEGFSAESIKNWTFVKYKNERVFVVYFKNSVRKRKPILLFGVPDLIENVAGKYPPTYYAPNFGIIEEIRNEFYVSGKYNFF